MKVTESHYTTITVEPGDKVRDLYAVLDEMPNGAEINMCAPTLTDLAAGQYAVIYVDHLSIKG
ncbi:hypothetical protein I5G97_gp052 [Mycobacterium phage Curiosium]|uniref:Uncharacterized protein n=1 Tax=Mycobacterium phage Curiosium TaxID=2599859 RepID=A0A5J6U085_9CAUD|nr:hypothetical protein I5G97_gp052 [Mycobacterium phage Curiosium]QFG14102.1 hypothetical protein PBI_CURIOSIUM_58 [Mycobacterium phage Curiosium]